MTPADLQQALSYLYQSGGPNVSYTMQTDAAGQATIALWDNSLGTQPTPAQLATALAAAQLQVAKDAQTTSLQAAYMGARYNTAVQITTAAGASVSIPTDESTQTNVAGYLVAYAPPNKAPATMPLIDATGAVQSLALSDLQAIAKATADASVAAFNKLTTLLGQVQAATTIADVQAVVWG